MSKGNRRDVLRREPHYEIAIFIMLILAFLFSAPDIQHLNQWTSIYYVLSYADFGFQSRLVIGSVIRLFTSYVSTRLIYTIITVFSVLFIVFVSLTLGRIARNISKNAGVSAEILIVIFIACPVAVQYLFNINNYGRFDLFSIVLTVCMLFCIKSRRAKWLVPALCALAVILNFNYVFMYLPVLAVAMICEYVTENKSKTRLLILILSCALSVALFIYFKSFAYSSDFKSIEEVKAYLGGITDVQGGETQVFYDLCYPLAKFYHRGTQTTYEWFFDLLMKYGLYMLFSTGPVFTVFIAFWLKAAKNARRKLKRAVLMLCLLAPAASLPMFLAIDWDRWVPTLFLSQFMLVLYFIASNDIDAAAALASLKKYFNRHSLLFAVLVLYSASSVFSNSYSVYVSVLSKYIDDFLSLA